MIHQALQPPPVLQLLLLLAGTVAWLGFSEALLKPLSVTLMFGLAPGALAQGLMVLDTIVPELLAEGVRREDVESEVRRRLDAATGLKWTPLRMWALRRWCDPIVMLEHNATGDQP